VCQVSVVEFLCSQEVAVVPGPQLAGLDAVGLEELLVGHAERLADGLGYGPGLGGQRVTVTTTRRSVQLGYLTF